MDIRVIFLAVVGFFGGIYGFFRGFWIYREYRLLSDTPETPIRSLSMGLAEIHGQAKGEAMLLSPVTCTPCYLYQVEVDRSRRNTKGEKTESHFFTDLKQINFSLEDSSGKVLVNPRDAELDLEKRGQRMFFGKLRFDPEAAKSHGGRMDPERAGRRPSEDDLKAYVSLMASRRNLVSATSFLGEFDEYSLEECCIVPDAWYDVTGTCVENAKPVDEHDLNMIVKGENEKTFLISSKNKKDIQKMLLRRALVSIFFGAGLSVGCLALLLWMFS
jgi:hypothetical protein